MLKCLIIDDEPLAREGIASYVAEIDFLRLMGTCANPLEASQYLGAETIDLIFLDIQMPKINGIDFLKSLQNPPMVIMTTAFPNYALDGFQLNAIDYLLKPITFQRFFTAANKAKEQFLLRQKVEVTYSLSDDYFFVKCDNKLEKIRISEILFIEGMQNYVTIHTETGKYLTLLTMKSLEEKLNTESFLRVHKSFLVSITKIDGMEGSELIIQTHRVPVSRNYKEAMMERLNQRLWKK